MSRAIVASDQNTAKQRGRSRAPWATAFGLGLVMLMLAAHAPAAAQDAAPAQDAPPAPAAEQAPTQSAPASEGKTVKTLDGKEVNIDDARRQLEQHKKQLEDAKQEQQTITAETKALEAERVAMQARLIEAAKKSQGSEKRLIAVEAELDKLSAQETLLRVALNENRTTVAQMLGIMQRMGREPPPVMVTKRHDALKMVRSAMLLSSFFPGFKSKVDTLSKQLTELNVIGEKTRTEKQRLAEAQTEFKRTKEEVDTLMVRRREQMKKNAARLDELKTAVNRHGKAVGTLGDLLQRLDGEAGKQANMAAYEAELKQLGTTYEIKPDAKQVAFVQPGRLKPSIPFDKARGLLRLPCQGKRLTAFGGRDETGSKSEGLRLETLEEASIVSPSDGWVIYAGQFRTYGQLLIINAGGGYHILLAGMDQIHSSVGQFVLAGEPVAAMGKAQPPSANSPELRKPMLYIEFRKDAHPIDSDPWWAPEGVKEG